ncbi:MAG: M48 family metalloprotease [Phycisphaerales bacterium]|nr:M48 family metalloprotease [Phycisphaerales bacterium]
MLSSFLILSSCGKNGGLNIFFIEGDKTLGLQTKNQIESAPANYPILNLATNTQAYAYINALRDEILASDQITHKDDFAWEVKIVKDDNVQNALGPPGGFYVYTGLIKYLDNPSSLAGVMGHEMAHADMRHSTNQMTKQYGIPTMLDVVLGKNQGLRTQVSSQLISLQFSRTDESQADEYSVQYLCSTQYHSDGATNFFQKIIDQGGATPPAFLSSHPSPDDRVKNIRQAVTNGGCQYTTICSTEDTDEYTQFKALL